MIFLTFSKLFSLIFKIKICIHFTHLYILSLSPPHPHLEIPPMTFIQHRYPIFLVAFSISVSFFWQAPHSPFHRPSPLPPTPIFSVRQRCISLCFLVYRCRRNLHLVYSRWRHCGRFFLLPSLIYVDLLLSISPIFVDLQALPIRSLSFLFF